MQLTTKRFITDSVSAFGENINQTVFANQSEKINAPEFIYWVVYGEYPEYRLPGRGTDHPEQMIEGITIDKAIPVTAIKELNEIKEIEPRSSCQGESKMRPTFLIIRMPKFNEKKIDVFCREMRRFDETYCNYDVGNQEQIRIGIAALLWPEKDRKAFEKWWLQLPDRIEDVLTHRI